MHTSGTCHQKFRCSKFDDFFDHQIWEGVGYKFLSRGFRKFFSPIFLAKNKSFEQKTTFETKNSGLQWLFEDLSSSRKNPQNQIFTHFRISVEITKEIVFLRISGEITKEMVFLRISGEITLVIGCSQLTSIPCVWCVQITLFTSWKGYGSTSGTKTCILKEKKKV